MMLQQDSANPAPEGSAAGDKVSGQLADAFNTQVTTSTSGPAATAAVTSIPALSTLPTQFGAASLTGLPSGGLPSILQSPPQTLPSMAGGYASPVLFSTSAAPSPLSVPPQSTLVGLAPLTPLPSSAKGPPPRTGFQPMPHTVQDYESHHSSTTQQQRVMPPVISNTPALPAGQTGVNIFTPAYDPNAPPSPYSSPAPATMPAAPSHQGISHHGSDSTSVQLSFDGSSPAPANYNHPGQQTQDLGSIIEWIKTNETVHRMMQKAKIGVETVITAMDPQMRDVLYSGGDIDIMVASSKAVKVGPVKDAFQRTFGRATVNGRDSQPGIAPQPVGYSAGIKGAEERISSLRRSGLVNERQVCVAIESFIVDVQPEQWYDISCLLLSDPVNNMTLQTFSQATPVSIEYVQQAQSETPPDYNLAWSGLAVTVGQVMHRHCPPGTDPSDWHSYYAGVSRADILLLAAKQLACMYKQRLSRRK